MNYFSNLDQLGDLDLDSLRPLVFTNGCFDILHVGHVRYLNAARKKGATLILGLNSDESVKKLKGPDRPINSEKARAEVLLGLSSVDIVVRFQEDTPLELIKKVRPDILVKGADYNIKTIVGSDFVLSIGGKVETIDLVKGFSTTKLIEKSRPS